MMITWQEFTSEVRATYQAGETTTERDVLDRYVGLDYLAIDDLGVGKLDGSGRESDASRVLCNWLQDERYKRSHLTTDVSSNCLPEDLVARFDERIGRRLRELTTVYPMFLEGGRGDAT